MLLLSFTGRLSNEPDLKYLPGSGLAVLTFNLISDRMYQKDYSNKATDIIKCTIFGKRAEGLSKVLTKGYLVTGHGELQCNRDDNNITWYSCKVDSLQLLNKPKGNQNDSYDSSPRDTNGLTESDFSPMYTIDDDDIPF